MYKKSQRTSLAIRPLFIFVQILFIKYFLILREYDGSKTLGFVIIWCKIYVLITFIKN